MQNKKVLNYTMLRPLGVGGMAEVWYAENNIHKPGAVKFLLQKFCSDFDVVSRFRTEAEVMVRLNHPNIRQVYDYDEVDGRPCIVMEYLEGDDLASRMKHGERFTDEQLKNWWNQIADALNYTHQQGVVHRDLKPSNIFVDQKGNVKLLDFGIAKVRDSITSTHTGATMGTLMYMSPEQVRDSKHIDHKTDLYSLAVTFVHLLTGNAPYDRDTTDDFEIRNNIVNIPLGLDTLPLDWQNFLRPYLAKDPKERPALRIFDAAGADRGDFVPLVAPESPAPSASEETVVMAENKPIPVGYVDLGLPSGTLWKEKNESEFYDYDAAVQKFGNSLPTKGQLEELKTQCQWTWIGNGYKVVSPNGQSIVLPAAGYRNCSGDVYNVGSYGYYWSSTPNGSDDAWDLYFNSGRVYMDNKYRCYGRSVRLVQD